MRGANENDRAISERGVEERERVEREQKSVDFARRGVESGGEARERD